MSIIYSVRNLGAYVVWMRGVRILSTRTQLEANAVIAALKQCDDGLKPEGRRLHELKKLALDVCIEASKAITSTR